MRRFPAGSNIERMHMKIVKKFIIRWTVAVLYLGVFAAAAVYGINAYVVYGTDACILSPEDAAILEDVDCILVLGCQVRNNGVPSHMLEDRLRRGVELYESGAAPKLLMSGDHGQAEYNEVVAMKQYALDAGIQSEDVFMDHAGFSTYESMYRAREIFQADKIIIVTQEYHLYRALHIARSLGIEAYGVSADYRIYSGQGSRDVREVLARVKDFGTSLFKPDPTYLGESIPITGSGDMTNDDKSVFHYPERER